jgi:ABC-type polysaccharide/polyol phosphate transport system ATPase subunit
MPVDDTVISVKGLSKSYRRYRSPVDRMKALLHPFGKKYHKDFWALREINMEVEKGTTFGIIGQNGCGKSTLLQVLCGILQPTKGKVEVKGKVAALLELGAGFSPEFTGRENVYMNGALMGLTREEMDERFEAVADFADIGDFIDQPVKHYSSGMYVRLAFAVAINVDPDVLVIDEALAVGDDMFKRRCYKKFEDFQKQGKTILFVSHTMGTVLSLCTRTMLLDKGTMVHVGSPKEVVNTYNNILAEKEEEYAKRLRGGKPAVKEDERLKKPETASIKDSRFGAGDAELLEVKIIDEEGRSVTLLEFGKVYTVKITALFKKEMEEPAIGFIVKTLKGLDVCGTSTFVADRPIGRVKAGTTVEVDFQHKMRLNAGSYFISPGVVEFAAGNRIVHDRILDMIAFKVVGKGTSFGLVDMDASIRLTVSHSKEGKGAS